MGAYNKAYKKNREPRTIKQKTHLIKHKQPNGKRTNEKGSFSLKRKEICVE